ncbi:MAG: beta-hydroxyacyl-ACP dehydratase [Planctomycetales bacterium]|nr:beta-hydroxyacyl-ACP dehydratase [Planctomycetales bacterium]
MPFSLIDRILDVEPGKRITAVKSPTLSEEYLQDHFPLFPVMPGVLMLESMYQAGAWLLRVTDGFRHSMVLLKEARNVKYAGFVRPGQTLTVTVEMVKREDGVATLKASGSVGGDKPDVSARLLLEHYDLADQDPSRAPLDRHILETLRSEYAILTQA